MNAADVQHGQPAPEVKCAALWLTAKKIAAPEVEDIEPRGVRDRINRALAGLNGTRSRYERLIATNGGKSYEYNYSLLAEDFPGTVRPEALRAAIEKYSVRESQEQLALEAVTPAAQQPAPVEEQTLALPFPKEITELCEIPERERRLVEARFRAIEHAEGDNWRKWQGQSIHGILVRIKKDFIAALARDYKLAARGQGCLVDWNAIHAELSQGTRKRDRGERRESSFEKKLWRWLRWYRKGKQTKAFNFAPGLAALRDAPTVHAGKSKLFGEAPRTLAQAKIAAESERMTPAGKRLVELMLFEKLSVQMTQETLLHERAELGLPKTLSHSAVNRFYRKIPKPLLISSRGRAQDFHDKCAPHAARDYTTCAVMERWNLDHAEDDLWAINDYIEKYDRLAIPDLPRDAALRIWWTFVQDIRSRKIVGYMPCSTPSSDSILSAMRMALLQTGRMPLELLLDRGKDMKMVGEDKYGVLPEAQGPLLRLCRAQHGTNGEIVFSIGRHPESKPIERFFGTKRTRFDSRTPSYCGRRPVDRPDRCTEMLDQHKQFLLGKRASSPLPLASEVIANTIWWVENWYNRKHRHTGQSMGRRTPEEVFRRGYPDSERQEALAKLDRKALDEFLRHREPRKVSRGGCIDMFNQEFEPADEQSRGRLLAYFEREVLVAADSFNVGDAVVFDPQTGERLGDLVCKKLLAWGASKADIRANMRLQRSAAKSCRTYVEHLRKSYHAPKGAFGFLGPEALRATGTDGMRALPPGRPLKFAGAPAVEAAPVITSDFIEKQGDFGDVKVKED